MSDMLHIKAIEIIGRSLRDSVEGKQEAREQMALGQYIAEMGFSNVGLGLVHGMAHPLSAWYNVPHGVACAAIDQLSKDVGIPSTISELGVQAEDLAKIAEDAFRDVCTPGNPREASIDEIIALYRSLM